MSRAFITKVKGFYRSYSTMSEKSAVIFLAPGSEEMELVISADVLRRAGVKVTIAGLTGLEPTKCSRDLMIVPDKAASDAIRDGPYDAVILPGGLGGSKCFVASAEIGQLLKDQESSGRLVAAICAAPTALKAHGIALGKSLTSYPSFKEELSECYNYLEDRVVVDGNLITSRGPTTAFDFAMAISNYLVGKETTSKVAKGLLLE
ncbi:protein dj-1beta [Cimex lectularius]|uniref:DJ-1/PfpI domain-containing protein n=1 Tax=Cimex lectularius TaxID=79782 RepID=A0A8I6S206_CIMLE|nr:protein dj-1beta [Cimex lectularius]